MSKYRITLQQHIEAIKINDALTVAKTRSDLLKMERALPFFSLPTGSYNPKS